MLGKSSTLQQDQVQQLRGKRLPHATAMALSDAHDLPTALWELIAQHGVLRQGSPVSHPAPA